MPEIFNEKYKNYEVNNADSKGSVKILLNKNFRSRFEVLDDINIIFNLIMDNYIGGAEYSVSHNMIFGNTTYINEGKTKQNNNLEIYNYEYDKNIGFKQEEIEMENSTDSDIHSKSWSKVNPSLLDMKMANRGNLFLYGDFRFRTDTNFCWFRIKSPKAPRSVNAAIKDTNLSTTMSAPVVYWDDTYIYIGVKGAFDSGISFTCFF